MSVSASPLHFLVFTIAGWINRHQQTVIEYLQEENRILKKQLRGKRLRLTDDQRRRLAVEGKASCVPGPSPGTVEKCWCTWPREPGNRQSVVGTFCKICNVEV